METRRKLEELYGDEHNEAGKVKASGRNETILQTNCASKNDRSRGLAEGICETKTSLGRGNRLRCLVCARGEQCSIELRGCLLRPGPWVLNVLLELNGGDLPKFYKEAQTPCGHAQKRPPPMAPGHGGKAELKIHAIRPITAIRPKLTAKPGLGRIWARFLHSRRLEALFPCRQAVRRRAPIRVRPSLGIQIVDNYGRRLIASLQLKLTPTLAILIFNTSAAFRGSVCARNSCPLLAPSPSGSSCGATRSFASVTPQ